VTAPRESSADSDQPDGTVDTDTLGQIRERLSWTPAQRLAYLRDMVAFEQRAHAARRLA